jgi:hypothetical protein
MKKRKKGLVGFFFSAGFVTGAASLKVPNCEIFDRSDFHDFYTIKVSMGGDFEVKIKFKKYRVRAVLTPVF